MLAHKPGIFDLCLAKKTCKSTYIWNCSPPTLLPPSTPKAMLTQARITQL